MRCVVLGGRGFIGSHLVRALAASGHAVRSFDRPGAALPGYEPVEGVDWIEGDFLDRSALAAALAGCTVCYHLVSTTTPSTSNVDPLFDIESNLKGSVALLSVARSAGLRKIVFLSSGGTVYGQPRTLPIAEDHPTFPLCSYGIVKLAIERYLELEHRLHGLDYTVLRAANPFGEGQRTDAAQGAIAVFLGRALRGAPIEIWGDGSAVRDYLYIDDLVEAIMRAGECAAEERIINIGSGRGLSLNEVLDAIERVTGRPTQRVYRPARALDVAVSLLDIGRAERVLGWRPRVGFETGLRRFAAWLAGQAPSSAG